MSTVTSPRTFDPWSALIFLTSSIFWGTSSLIRSLSDWGLAEAKERENSGKRGAGV